jgi:hypothetical protein
MSVFHLACRIKITRWYSWSGPGKPRTRHRQHKPGWPPGYFEDTFGSITDDTFNRPPQGELRDRTAYLFDGYSQNEAAAVSPDDFTPPACTASWRRQYLVLPAQPANRATPVPAVVTRTTAVLAAPGGCADGTGCWRQNRSRVNRGRLLHSRPGGSRFCRQGRVSCRIRCCGRFRRWCR